MTPRAAIRTMASCPYVPLMSEKYAFVMRSVPFGLPSSVSASVKSVFIALNSGTGTSNGAAAKDATGTTMHSTVNNAIIFFICPPRLLVGHQDIMSRVFDARRHSIVACVQCSCHHRVSTGGWVVFVELDLTSLCERQSSRII